MLLILNQNLASFFQETARDIVFHCKNNTKLTANKLVLALGSKFLRNIFAGMEKCCDAAFDVVNIKKKFERKKLKNKSFEAEILKIAASPIYFKAFQEAQAWVRAGVSNSNWAEGRIRDK
jgi:hypothetical protein